ncbi:cation:proton antiporter [Gammaproteobacteria bacterium]|nr:cation:proton antiporter [Gammaproteobacteria bacterium]
MNETTDIILSLGSILLLGMAADFLGKRTFLPRITILLILGILIGQEVFNLIPTSISTQFELVSNITLIMVGFLIGGKLSKSLILRSAKSIMWISMTAALGAIIIVGGGLLMIGIPKEIAILLACISAATAPGATVDLVIESGSESSFSKKLLAIVALDDVWGLVIFSIGLSVVAFFVQSNGTESRILAALWDIIGAVLLGAFLGYPAAHLSGRLRPGRPMFAEALGLVLFCGGLALWLDVSFIIASMVMGAMIRNFAEHHEYGFHEIEDIEWPFMIVFFILAGASLQFDAVQLVLFSGGFYIALRAAGKIIGSYLGALISDSNKITKNWMGLALLPQAGVAIGMALVATNQFPQYRDNILPIVIFSTIFFEIIGPVFTRLALSKADKLIEKNIDEFSE